MTQQSAHLIIEEGPERGREILIAAGGARLGRSSHNDIVLRDPAMSRFHCRFFFKPNEGLWAEDLGGANQSLLNDQALHLARIQVGDRLTLGDTILRVISTTPPPATVHDLFSVASTESADGTLGGAARLVQFLRPRSGPDQSGRNAKQLLSWLLVALLLIGSLIVTVLHFVPSQPALAPADSFNTALEIHYEKVQANSNNIFRYQLTLQNKTLSIQIDDLQNRRHVPGNQLKSVDAELIQSLADSLQHANFFELREEYKGLPADVWDLWDLSISIGLQTRRVRVLNTLEPEVFKATRETIEEFGQNELGLTALALTPEKLISLARDATLLGRSLHDQRNVKNGNLALAIRSLQEAEWYLETIEPKPDFYADAVALRGEGERELEEVYQNLSFLAERHIRLREWAEAARQLRLICEEIPERQDRRHAGARKKLIDVERRLEKK